uniref:Uncharacterized protein n=1 Tax=Brassica oleracea var. oleracea TaxID=109376 RepID=A0A0D3AD98_BRAOL
MDTCPSESLKIKTLYTSFFVISASLSKLSPISLSLTATPVICELPSLAIPLTTVRSLPHSTNHGLGSPRKHAIPHPVVLHPVAAEVVRLAVPVHRDHLSNKIWFPHMFPLPLPLHMFPLLRRIRGSCQFNNWFNNQQEFTWESSLTETVRRKFNEKTMDSYTKQINAWKTLWQKNKRPQYINGTVWEQLIVHWEKDGTAVTSQTPGTGRAIVAGKIEANDGNPVDRLQLIKEAHTNKKTGQIQDAVIRSVDLVETQKEALLSSQHLSDDDDSTGASTNMFRLQINEMVEKAVPKRKGGRLVGFARRASSYPASSLQVVYTDPMILEQLQNKDERIVALEEQNATILSENATILAQLESQKKTNAGILERLDRLLPSGS